MSENEARVERVARAIGSTVADQGDFSLGYHLAHKAARAALAAATAWQPIETAPRDKVILVYGIWAGEINGTKDQDPPDVHIVKFSGRTDYPGYDWACQDTDAYAAWVKATHWMLLPEPPVNTP